MLSSRARTVAGNRHVTIRGWLPSRLSLCKLDKISASGWCQDESYEKVIYVSRRISSADSVADLGPIYSSPRGGRTRVLVSWCILRQKAYFGGGLIVNPVREDAESRGSTPYRRPDNREFPQSDPNRPLAKTPLITAAATTGRYYHG